MNLPVTIWTISLEQSQQVIADSYVVLSPDEQQRAERYQAQQAKESFILTRSALRQILAKRIGCPATELRFDYGEQGKPILRLPIPDESFSFSVSHSGKLAIVALSNCEHLGVDCEKYRPFSDSVALARKVLGESEWGHWCALGEQEQADSLLKTWTLKEACLKAIGLGLAIPMQELEIRSEAGSRFHLTTAQELLSGAAPWSMAFYEQVSGYRLAVAAADTSCKIAAEFREFDFGQ